jgi:hypothetical protein
MTAPGPDYRRSGMTYKARVLDDGAPIFHRKERDVGAKGRVFLMGV